MVQNHSQKAQQNIETQSSINLDDVGRTSPSLSQHIISHE